MTKRELQTLDMMRHKQGAQLNISLIAAIGNTTGQLNVEVQDEAVRRANEHIMELDTLSRVIMAEAEEEADAEEF